MLGMPRGAKKHTLRVHARCSWVISSFKRTTARVCAHHSLGPFSQGRRAADKKPREINSRHFVLGSLLH